MHPEFDFHHNELQRLGRAHAEFDHVTLTVSSFAGHTVIVFGWIGEAASSAAALADSFGRVDDDRKADALVLLLFVHSDNVFLRPSWWAALPEAEQDDLNHLMGSGTTARVCDGAELVEDGKSFVTANLVETVGN